MALYPRQNSTFACNIVALNYCLFSHSNIQLHNSTFSIQKSMHVHNLNATLFIEHVTLLFNVQCMRCKMRYASNAIQLPCSLHSQSISIFCFHISSFNMQHSCLSMQRWSLLRVLRCRVRYACSTIQYSSLDIKLHARVNWPWDSKPLYKVCGLKIVACGVPVFQVTQWWQIVETLGRRLGSTRRPHFVAWRSNC